LYVAYWHAGIGRDPDWDKWLRPRAWCPRCAEVVDAIQVFKKPRGNMGRYRAQYVYRCPRSSCRYTLVEPEVLPALVAIDPTIPGLAIKDRPSNDPLAAATIARIRAGIRRYWLPLLTPAGGTWREDALPLHLPMPTRTTTESDGVAVPPLVVPVEARAEPGRVATIDEPIRTQTARNETALAAMPLPFITPLRGGGDRERARAVTDPLCTVSAQGNHHGLALPPLVMRNNTARGDQGQMTTPAVEPLRTLTAQGNQSLLTWAEQLLVPYYGNAGSASPAAGPVGTLTARDRYGLAQPGADHSGVDVDELIGDVLFRMLEPHEIATAMAFTPDYKTVAKSKRHKVRLFGNAVTPPVAEVIVSALVEALSGEETAA
jgi:DNA (cytosine-5)-methyltransferase 1